MSPTEDPVTVVDERPIRAGEADPDPPPPALRPELEHALRREIEHALQPVLADFREQSVRAVREQVSQAQRTARGEERPSPARHRDGESRTADGAPEQPGGERTPSADRTVASESAGPVAEFVEQLGARWLQSRLEGGRDALCSERVRDRVRESADQVLRPLLDAGADLIPGEPARRELREDAGRTLDELIEDALEELCSEPVLTELQQRGERAFYALVQGDVGKALREMWEAVRALLRAFLSAVRGQWARAVHLLLDIFLRGAQEMVGTMLKEGLATVAAVPVEETEEKAESAKETLEDRGAELRDRLAERFEALQERVKEEVGQVKQRVADGLQAAVKDGTHGDSFGRPPTGRPPSLRPPSGRPPTGRPPSARPPSGRPPSMSRRGA